MHDHKRIWRIYNQELVDRGRPSRYLSTALVRQREDLRIMNKSKVGKPYEYSDIFIIAGFAVKTINKCGYRQAEGTISDYLTLLGIENSPDFRTIQWRIQQLKKSGIKFMIDESTNDEEEIIDVIIDSTGVRSRKDGEYRSKMYRNKKRWKQIHIAISKKTHKILNIKVTKDHAGDPNQFVELMRPIVKRRKVNSANADGAYGSEDNFRFCDDNNIEPIIPVKINSTGLTTKHHRKRAVEQLGLIRKPGKYRQPTKEQRKENLERWKNESGYHQRSLIECVIGVFKGIFDESVFSKKKDMIEKELLLKAFIYNTFII
jgi:hypothetical protein